jgi:phage protein D/phage baseplate assembly protein gpV
MPASHFTQLFIKINGTDISPELMHQLEEAVVDTSLHMPGMFTLLFQDPELKWVDDTLFEVGKAVEISIQTGQEQGNLQGSLIKGEITAIEPDFSPQGKTTLLIRGYDKSHRLHRGKKTQTFLKQTDSDIVRKIAGEAGLTSEVDATSVRYDYVLQNNQTNMEFLLARAERIGYQVYGVDGKLCFKKGEANQGEGPELALGETLLNFRPSLTTTHQADKMIVRGWDPKLKRPIVSEGSPNGALNQGGIGKTGGAAAQQAFGGSAQAVVVDQPIFTVDEAKALMEGLRNDISRDFIQAEGECFGDPRVKAGWMITLKGIGTRFGGKYFVTSATHIYNEAGYKTTFSISGRRPNTLSHLLEQNNGSGQAPGLIYGVVTALVTNLNDPENLGRVKVKYAWLGDNIESDWVRMVAPMGGGGRGFFYLPEVNDEVLVAFEHGDPHRPYVVGILWNNQDKPPVPNSTAVGGGRVNQRVLKSRSGHVITLDDTQGQEQIIVRDKTGNNELVIASATNDMTIKVDGNFTVEAKGKITLKSIQDLSLEATTGNSSVKGMQLNLEGKTSGALKAPTVSMQGQALAEVKGAIVKLN